MRTVVLTMGGLGGTASRFTTHLHIESRLRRSGGISLLSVDGANSACTYLCSVLACCRTIYSWTQLFYKWPFRIFRSMSKTLITFTFPLTPSSQSSSILAFHWIAAATEYLVTSLYSEKKRVPTVGLPGLFLGSKAAGAWYWPLTPVYRRGWVLQLYLYLRGTLCPTKIHRPEIF